MPVYPMTVDLPDGYFISMGKIVAHWAQIERLLTIVTYDLLNLGPKHGRVAVRSPRPEEQITMIQQLMGLESVIVTEPDLTKLGNLLRDLKNARDLIAHGVWLIDPETKKIFVQELAGNWRPDPAGPKVAKRIKPVGRIIKESDLQDLLQSIKRATVSLERVRKQVREQLATLRNEAP